MLWPRRCALFLSLTLAACGGGDDTTAAGGAAGQGGQSGAAGNAALAGMPGAAGASTAGAGGGGAAGAPSGDPSWQRAFSKAAASVGCGSTFDAASASNAPRLTFGAITLFVGYEQVSGNNQDPVFLRFDGGTKTYCEHHEKQPPDGRALGLTWDGGPMAYVVYTVDGGGSDFDLKAKGGWLGSYGSGGGAKVSVLGEVEIAAGTLQRATYVIAKKQDGKTNTHTPVAAPTVLAGGGVAFFGASAFQPMNPDKTPMTCTDYPFDTRYVFKGDLAGLTCSSSTNCVAAVPCTD